jgi:hypothetical protein
LQVGRIHFTLMSDQVGHPQSWAATGDGFYVRSANSAEAVNDILLGLANDAPDAACAVDISAGNYGADLASAQGAQLLRLAQCAPRGITVTSASTALAMLSQFPAMHIEPLGELPDAGGAIEIYAIQPMA